MKKIEEILGDKDWIENSQGLIGYTQQVTEDAAIEYANQFKISWFPISDVKPMSYARILVWNGIEINISSMNGNGSFDIDNVLQWAELPSPPAK